MFAHLELPDGQHVPRKIIVLDENTQDFHGLDSFYTINLRGDGQVLSSRLRTIISIVLFMFRVKFLFLAHLDMWSISSKMVDELTDGI